MTPTEQFIQEATVTAETVVAWLGPDLVEQLWRRIPAKAPALIAEASGTDDGMRAEAVQLILFACHGHADPAPTWWATPLGKVCAVSLGTDPDEVTYSVAAAMLGLAPGTVASMMAPSRIGRMHCLERHPDGGIVRGSVMREISRRAKGRA